VARPHGLRLQAMAGRARVAGRHAHLHGFARSIYETSGLRISITNFFVSKAVMEGGETADSWAESIFVRPTLKR
jgi:hypothetical protein